MSAAKKGVDDVVSVEEILKRNKHYASTEHKKLPDLVSLLGGNPKLYGPHTVVISCLDSRSNPYQVLGLKPYEAIVLRNVSGRFTPVEVDIAALDTRFDVSQIILLQHTNCGASTITVKDMIESVQENRPELIGTQELADLEPRFPSVDHNSHRLLNLELQAVKNSKILRKDLIDNVVGLYLNVDTGLVEVVSPESTTI